MVLSITNLLYMFFLNSMYVVTSILSFGALRKYSRRLKSVSIEYLLTSAGAPPITMVVPSYNEESTCVESIRALLNLQYPEYEVLVVNDGSQDKTLKRLIDAYDLEPAYRTPLSNLKTQEIHAVYRSLKFSNLWVLDKANGGKADALNAGINMCQTPLFCAIDADSLLEQDALLRVVRPYLEESKTVAVGGIVRIANGCVIESGIVKQVRLPKTWLARFQALEYLRSFLSGRMGWSVMGGTLIISGAFGLFKRSLIVDIGGYATDTVGEDMELIVRLHRYCLEQKLSYDIAFIPDPVAWTECPEDMKTLANQRDRWQRGLMEALWIHRGMFFNPRYGRIGLLAYPYYFFLEMLGPVIELTGYLSILVTGLLGMLSGSFMMAFFLVAFVYGSIVSIFAIALEELTFRRYLRMKDLLNLILASLLESFGYRQLLTLWRARGMWRKLTRRSHSWGKMERKGFGVRQASP
ncbi:glycosyl transferase [bacterium (Candidatus Blackallbacteria) CG17_big_fil_post_rev_8_21_14_2_50_48_46]|uniref:Glycosyl transferase n=1 Tax=bacterium (Candidatus Blackallbacteria) CG17_big_fil_post_rev_8_21_14_2_50_48_46 TaxID=2014261 RepID=A0A2M7G581_9BACT|nr:MAG: glycosyl transferase [bacterium (Candidatus Blackallbacteria) CG18_big_fil_WC_8_21_14_2_50_49_26]PIW17084.1 MAG: glycosyl transferase [bacterium (Candidatus Blackallbacteria) CG17_big_fil_post_rev_8_21_14_2_50_48_46]PIW47729.1 MAG: glycosyl transferase [bacterium (Candidatus Blackallbacteria) CG13_big_fil_rev_8_21_14_2_50_49_14]